MLVHFWICSLLLVLAPLVLLAQEKKPVVKPQLEAERWQGDFNLDGVLDEGHWQFCPIATDFTAIEPTPGVKPGQKTEVRVAYDDEFLYVGALLLDAHPDSILHQLTQRDDLGNTDFFTVAINPYQDGINGFEFFVTPEGTLVDSRITADSEDWGWDAVWLAKATIHEKGWSAEFRIPFSAIRFPEKEVQTWDINFSRSVRRSRELSAWRFVDPEVDGFLTQTGVLNGITGVKTPIRLFFNPYLTVGVENYSEPASEGSPAIDETAMRIAGGMDLKYGLTDAFTLDMTVVPDFSQVQADNQILNITPFEVQFQENRAFFTEGTELFNKAGIFYSRRIGVFPKFIGNLYDNVQADSLITQNPGSSQLLNATKVSGRTDKGLGIGVFNAVTAENVARYQTLDGDEKSVVVDPLTNFSVIALDQNLKNNSYISLINTNVMREGRFYDANVTATEFELRNKENSISIQGTGAFSYRPNAGDGEEQGHMANLSIGKINGNFNAEIGYSQESDTYNPNDLGFLANNNSHDFYGYLGYFIYEPFGKFNRLWSNLNFGRSYLYEPFVFTENNVNFSGGMSTRKFFAFGLDMFSTVTESYDYFEPRADGRVFTLPSQTYVGTWISSDYRKPFALDASIGYANFYQHDRPRFEYNVQPIVRVNDHFNFSYSFYQFWAKKDEGFATLVSEDEIYFSVRDLHTTRQQLRLNYVFTPEISAFGRINHFWSAVNVLELNELANDGELVPIDQANNFSYGRDDYDRNFDGMTADIGFRWVFTPGSEFTAVYRLIQSDEDNLVTNDVFRSVNDSFEGIRDQIFTVRLLYFIDSLVFRKKAPRYKA